MRLTCRAHASPAQQTVAQDQHRSRRIEQAYLIPGVRAGELLAPDDTCHGEGRCAESPPRRRRQGSRWYQVQRLITERYYL
jgi:hypothetical protein